MRSTRWASWRAKMVVMTAGAALAVAGSGATPAHAAPVWRLPDALRGDRTTLPGQCVSTAPLTHVDHIRPDGIRQAATPAQGAASTDSQARAYYFRIGGGEVAQIVPPAGWKPLTATDQELKAYDFPPRPTDPADLAHWTDLMSTWKRAGRPGMCSTNLSNALPHQVTPSSVTVTAPTDNWAGGMNVNGSQTQNTFTQTDLKWVQPAFIHPPCSASAEMAIWSGLGGWNSVDLDPNGQGRLIQDGTDQDGSMWWQAIAPDYNTYQVTWTGAWAAPGDIVESLVIFDTTYHDASLYMFDSTTNLSQSTSFGPLGGHSGQDFYDGTTADFISESPTIGKTSTGAPIYAELARPIGNGTIYFPYATTNGEPIAQFPSWRINQTRDGIARQTTGYDGVHAWYNAWKNC